MTDLSDHDFPSSLSEFYGFLRQIPHGGSSVVYEVVSRRGRLRGRHLAVKRIALSDYSPSSASLHQALSHPSVTALHSVISSYFSDSFNYHVLELCSDGNLFDLISSRHPPFFSEKQIEQIVKDTAGALAYLKEERVIHRNICTSNILVAKGFKLKICDFKHAIQLRSGDEFISQQFLSATHPAPEMTKLPLAYDCAVDAWAFGYVICSCLGIDDPSSTLYRESTAYSSDLQDLIVSLLTADKTTRLDIEEIPKHRYLLMKFFTPNLTRSQGASFPGLRRDRNILQDVGNIKLQDFISTKSIKENKRVVSDPTTARTRTAFLSENEDVEAGRAMTEPSGNLIVQPSKFSLATRSATARNEPPTVDQRSFPIGTTRPIAFGTGLLRPATHKLASGSVTILPSLSLLVDFRESQRRQGLKGDQVLLINSTGVTIKVFSAPHLSVPSCLVEPICQYGIEELPPLYWKQYNGAANFVDQIKRKTPKMTVYKSRAKCTLMSNLPLADVEIVLYDEQSLGNTSTNQTSRSKGLPTLRVRYSRQRGSIEISQQFVGNRGTEWKKESKPCADLASLTASGDLSDLSRSGLNVLSEFLQTCAQLEGSDETVDSLSTHIEDKSVIVHDPLLSLPSVTNRSWPRKYQDIPILFRKEDNEHLGPIHEIDTPAPPLHTALSTYNSHNLFPHMRYIPLVGWCIRSPVPEIPSKRKYQILFTDGACLEVDFCSSNMKFLSSTGNTTRCRISDKSFNPELDKRVRVLKDFMLLYKDSSTTDC